MSQRVLRGSVEALTCLIDEDAEPVGVGGAIRTVALVRQDAGSDVAVRTLPVGDALVAAVPFPAALAKALVRLMVATNNVHYYYKPSNAKQAIERFIKAKVIILETIRVRIHSLI